MKYVIDIHKESLLCYELTRSGVTDNAAEGLSLSRTAIVSINNYINGRNLKKRLI